MDSDVAAAFWYPRAMTEPRRVKLNKRGESVPGARQSAPDECACVHLDQGEWDRVENDWSDITFITTGVTAVLGVPVGFARSRASLIRRAARLRLTVPDDAMLLLGAGKFRRAIMLEVEGQDASAKGLKRPGGIAFTRLLPAPWGDMRRVVEETKVMARERYGRVPDEMLVWYLTCRICSRARDFETLVVAHYKKQP